MTFLYVEIRFGCVNRVTEIMSRDTEGSLRAHSEKLLNRQPTDNSEISLPSNGISLPLRCMAATDL